MLALATHRLTQLLVEDEISKPIRVAVEHWAQGAPEFSFRERVDFAINCEACTSIWASSVVLVLDQHPLSRWVLRVLAGSQASLLIKAGIDRLDRDVLDH